MASSSSSEFISQVCLSIEVPPRLRNLHDLAMKYIVQRRHDMAVTLCRQSIVDLEKLSGCNHPDVAVVLNILALIYRDQNKYEECDKYLSDAVVIWEKAYGKHHPTVATALSNLAVLYGKQGRNEEGEILCREALEIREKLFGVDHPEVAKQLGNLAILCQNQAKAEEAEKYFQQALLVFESSYGPSDVNVIKTKSNLASHYRKRGMYKEASVLYRQLLRRTIDKEGASSDEINSTPSSQFTKEVSVEYDIPAPLRNVHDTAMKCISQRNYEQAEFICKESLADVEKKNGHDHPHVATIMNLLALVYQEYITNLAADMWYVTPSCWKKQLSFIFSELITNCMKNFRVDNLVHGSIQKYRYQNKNDESTKLLKEAIVIWEKNYGEDHPSFRSYEVCGVDFGGNVVISSCLQLEMCVYPLELGLYRIFAERAFQDRLTLAQGLIDRDRLKYGPSLKVCSVTAALNYMTVLFGKQGKSKEGETACRRALEIREKVVGKHHPDVAKLLGNLALICQNQGRYDEVEKYYEQALQIFELTLGPDDPNITKTKANLASFYQKQRKYKEAVNLYKQLLKRNHECFTVGHQSGHGEAALPPNEGWTETVPEKAHHTSVEKPNTTATQTPLAQVLKKKHQALKKELEESKTKYSNLAAEREKSRVEGTCGEPSKEERDKELFTYHMNVLKLQEKAETAKKRYYEEKMKRLISK